MQNGIAVGGPRGRRRCRQEGPVGGGRVGRGVGREGQRSPGEWAGRGKGGQGCRDVCGAPSRNMLMDLTGSISKSSVLAQDFGLCLPPFPSPSPMLPLSAVYHLTPAPFPPPPPLRCRVCGALAKTIPWVHRLTCLVRSVISCKVSSGLRTQPRYDTNACQNVCWAHGVHAKTKTVPGRPQGYCAGRPRAS